MAEDLQFYDVSIFNQPTNPIQTCELNNESGHVSGTDVVNVVIDCDFGDDLIYTHGFEQ